MRRRRSQLDLSIEVGVSARHLSFVETGRSRPSPELILILAEHLEVPLRERNTLLLAAGYAPRYPHTSLQDPSLQPALASVQRMLDAHDPYPGVVVDRQWNVILANGSAAALTADIPESLAGPPLNVYRVCLHPDGLAARTVNFPEWAAYLLGQLRRSVALSADPQLEALQAEVTAYPNVAALDLRAASAAWDEPPLLVPLELRQGDRTVSMFTTLTTFGTARDITLEELAIELFFPADAHSEQVLRAGSTVAVS